MDHIKVVSIKHIRQTYLIPLDSDIEIKDVLERIEDSDIPADYLEEVISEDIVSIMAG